MRRFILFALAVAAISVSGARAGVSNPDISVIGQPLITWTDDAGSTARKRPVFNVGETEFIFDAALNPYARGTIVGTLAEGEFALEEGYFTLQRGLPWGTELKGGKYRVGFGKLNAAHPHTYPFAERFGVLEAYLPSQAAFAEAGTLGALLGDPGESFSETGVDLSWRAALPGDAALTASADVLQGDSFRILREPSAFPNDPGANLFSLPYDQDDEPRAAWLGRLSAFIPRGDRSGIELGATATQGTNNVAANARTLVMGFDAKAKLWTAPSAYFLLQGEWLAIDREDAGWDGIGYTRTDVQRAGGYAFVDYNWAQRYNVGASFERFEAADASRDGITGVGVFAGLALMEETTAFRLDWRRVSRDGTDPGTGFDYEPVQSLTLRAIFSMGPHKAHQF